MRHIFLTVGLPVLITVGFVWVLLLVQDERHAFMRECQDYGMPHYQCVSMWRKGAALLIIPTPIPIYHGPQGSILPVDPN